jgi:hypothetical protein
MFYCGKWFATKINHCHSFLEGCSFFALREPFTITARTERKELMSMKDRQTAPSSQSLIQLASQVIRSPYVYAYPDIRAPLIAAIVCEVLIVLGVQLLKALAP